MKRFTVNIDTSCLDLMAISTECDEVDERNGFLLVWKGEDVIAGFDISKVVAWTVSEPTEYKVAEQTEPNCQECMWCADGEQTCPNPNLCYYAPRQTEPLNVLTEVRDRIEAIPSADRPQGEWIAQTENYHSHWVCSECGAWALLEYNEQMCLSNFCPDCGADMRERKEKE